MAKTPSLYYNYGIGDKIAQQSDYYQSIIDQNLEEETAGQRRLALHQGFEEAEMPSPFMTSGEGDASFDFNAKPIKEQYDDPKKELFRQIYNDLVIGKGKIKRADFIESAFKSSMTANYAKMFGAEGLDLFKGIKFTEDGVSYKGNNIKLSPEQYRIVSDYSKRISSTDKETSFFDDFLSTTTSLIMDTPLLLITGGLSAKAAGASKIVSLLSQSSGIMPRMLGTLAHQLVNFQILEAPTTVEGFKEGGLRGGLDAMFHSTGMAMMATATGGTGRTLAMKSPFISSMMKNTPLLREEIGSLMGSFGFGYASTKAMGGTTRDGVVAGLSFAATHFTNPTAYKRVIEEQIRKPLEVFVDREKGIISNDYYVRKDDGKLYKIDKERFKKQGEITPLDGVEGLKLTPDLEKDVIHYNQVADELSVSFWKTLENDNINERSKLFLNDMKKDMDPVKFKENLPQLELLAKSIVLQTSGDKLRKLFGKQEIPSDAELQNKMIQFSESKDAFSLSYPTLKKLVRDNIEHFVKDKEAAKERIMNTSLPEEAKPKVIDLLETAEKALINKSKGREKTVWNDVQTEQLMDYHKAKLAEAIQADDLGGMAYHNTRIIDLAETLNKNLRQEQSIADKSKPKKKYEGEIPVIGQPKEPNKKLQYEIDRIKSELTQDAILQANKRALRALEQPEKTTAEALYNKEGSIKKEIPVKRIESEKPAVVKSEEKIAVPEKSEVIEKISKEDTKTNEISLLDNPSERIEESQYKNIEPGSKLQPVSFNKEFIPELSKDEPANSPKAILRNELEKVYSTLEHSQIEPEFFIVNRLKDRGYGRVEIANTIRDLKLGAYKDKTDQQIKDKVANILKEDTKKLKEQRNKYNAYKEIAQIEKDKTTLPKEEPIEMISESDMISAKEDKKIEEMSDEEIYALEKQNRDKSIYDEENFKADVYEKGGEESGMISSSVTRLKSGEHGLTKKAENKHYENMKKELGLDISPIDINTKEGQGEFNKRTAQMFKRKGDLSEQDMKAYDRIVNELMGFNEDTTTKQLDDSTLYSRKDLPENIKRSFDKGRRKLTQEEIDYEIDRLNKAFNKLGSDWKARYDESLDEKGLVNFKDRVLKLGKSAAIDTPHHETLHMAISALGKEKVWNRFLKDAGWNGVGGALDLENNSSLRPAHERLAEEYADYRLGYTPDRNGIFAKMSDFFRRMSSWLRGNGWYSKADYFKMLADGNLGLRDKQIVLTEDKVLYSNKDEYKIDTEQSGSVKKEHEEFKVLNYINRKQDYAKHDLVDKISFKKLAGFENTYQKGVKLFRESMTPPAWYTVFSPRFAEVHRPLEEMLVRGVRKEYNSIMKDVEGWNSGKVFRSLSKVDSDGLMELNRTFEKDIYDGVTPKGISTAEFIKRYGLNDAQAKVVKLYEKAVIQANGIARQGLYDRIVFHNEKIASTLMGDKDIELFFNDPFWKKQVTDENGKWKYEEIDKIINEDPTTKEEIAEHLSKKIYPDFDGSYYFNSVRPMNKNTWVIEATRPSTNSNHEPIYDGTIDANGKRNIIGYEEKISTYADDRYDDYGVVKYDSGITKDRIVSGLKEQGYKVTKEYNLGQEISKGEYWNRLTHQELINLANAGHIDLTEEVMQKLFESIKTGTYEQHHISKKYIPGLYHTAEEYEGGLSRFVRNAINSNYRQNAILTSRKKLQKWAEELNEKNPDKKLPDYEESKRDYEYAVKYYNNVTHSDESVIDTYKNMVSTFYTALKISFLTQQSLQGLQTTLHLAVAESDKNGLSAFYKGSKDAFGIGIKNIGKKRDRLPRDFNPMNVEEGKSKMMQDLDDAGLLGRSYKEELFGQADDIVEHYRHGLVKSSGKGKMLMNIMSANIERFTRIQSFSTFYDIGMSKGLKGNELYNYVGDKMHQSMSQWGVAGRPPISASKIIGKGNHPGIKALEKSFYTFKTFATHNLGLYEYLMRNHQWGALASKAAVGAGIHGITKFPFVATLFAVANLFTEDDMEYEFLDMLDGLDNETGGSLGKILGKGLPSIVGMDISSLMDEKSAFASDLLYDAQSRSAEGKLAEVMLGAPAGYASDAITTAEGLVASIKREITRERWSADEEKRIKKKLSGFLPLFIRNIMAGASLDKDGYQIAGKNVIKRDDLTYRDVVYKMMGFNPIALSDKLDEQFYGVPHKIARTKTKIKELKKIRTEIANSKDYDAVERRSELLKIKEMLIKFNKEQMLLEKLNGGKKWKR